MIGYREGGCWFSQVDRKVGNVMDVASLARDVTAALAPALPYLLPAGKAAVTEIGNQAAKKLGSTVWEQAQALWSKMLPKTRIKPAVKQAAQYVAENPDDADGHAALRVQLKTLLSEDHELAAQLTQLLAQNRHAGGEVSVTAVGERAVAIGRDAHGPITTGDQMPRGDAHRT